MPRAMSDLPAWVYDVVIALEKWSDEHPRLYVQLYDRSYVPAEECGCKALANVPADVRTESRAIAAYLRAHPTTKVNVPAMTLDSVKSAVQG